MVLCMHYTRVFHIMVCDVQIQLLREMLCRIFDVKLCLMVSQCKKAICLRISFGFVVVDAVDIPLNKTNDNFVNARETECKNFPIFFFI